MNSYSCIFENDFFYQSQAESMDIFPRIAHWRNYENIHQTDFTKYHSSKFLQSHQENYSHNVDAFFAPQDAPLMHPAHWGRGTHICVDKLTIIGSDNGLSPERHQSIIWTNAGILYIWPLATNFSEIVIEIQHFHWRKYVWKCRLWNVVHFVSASMC